MPPNRPTTSYTYWPALDGLRAISILLVIVSHGGMGHIVPGNLGVMIFFVISGFLITHQLQDEINTTHSICLRNFYWRRFLRLTPALLTYLLLFSLLLLPLGYKMTLPHISSALLYYVNYYKIFYNYPTHSPLPILWSLAVEEHFYVLFPCPLLLLSKRPKLLLPCLWSLCGLVTLWRILLFFNCNSLEHWRVCGIRSELRFHGTDAIADVILYGALAAIYYPKIKTCLPVGIFVLSLAALFFSLAYREPLFRETIRFTLQGISISILIIACIEQRFRLLNLFLESSWMRYIGKLSYSLYLFHFGIMVMIDALREQGLFPLWMPTFPAYFFLSFICAALSYHYIERPFLTLRRHWGAQAA